MLFVVIIVALLAFILGDFFNSGRAFFGPGTTMVEAGDAKVDYQSDYQQRYELASQRSNANTDPETLSQEVLRQLALEKLVEAECEDLGIVVTDTEIAKAFTGEVMHPYAQQLVAQISQGLGMSTVSGAAALDAVKNPAKYNLTPEQGAALRQDWANLETAVAEAMKLDKLSYLVSGLFTANEVDAKQLYNDIQTSYTVTYATKSAMTVNDEDVTVTDADRKAAWEEVKALYLLNEPTRTVSFIRVPVAPSAADRAEADAVVSTALAAINGSEDMTAVSSNGAFSVNRNRVATTTNVALKQFLDTAKVNAATQLSKVGDDYTLVKLLGKTQEIDSICLSFAHSIDYALLDSISKTVGEGKLAAAFEGTEAQAADDIWTDLYQANIPANLKAALETNKVGEFFILSDSTQGQAVHSLYRISERHAPVTVYEYAEITYGVDPSNKTINDLSSAITTYVSNNSSSEAFINNAAEAGYLIETARITPSSAQLSNLADSRRAVKWLMEAGAGKVMPVYQDNKQSYFMSAVVTGSYNDDYLPWNAGVIADAINVSATANKKAEKIVGELAGKAQDVQGYAALMGSEARTARFTFGGANRQFASAVQGAIAVADSATEVGTMKKNENVEEVSVDKNNDAVPAFNFAEYANQFNGKYFLGPQFISVRMFNLLLGKDEYKNESLNFVADFGK